MVALVPEVEGIDDFLEILGPEVYVRDRKEGNSIHGGVGLGRDMTVDTCWHQWYAEIPNANLTPRFGSSVKGRRSHVKPHYARLFAPCEVPWSRNCSR